MWHYTEAHAIDAMGEKSIQLLVIFSLFMVSLIFKVDLYIL